MENCIFCKIIKGDIPSYIVYEDKSFLGFLDIRPLTRGNSLVIPKTHFRWVDDVPNFGEYFEVARRIGLASKKILKANWVSYFTLGMEVPHAHIRVIPRYDNDLHGVVVDLKKIEDFTEEEMKDIANALLNETSKKVG